MVAQDDREGGSKCTIRGERPLVAVATECTGRRGCGGEENEGESKVSASNPIQIQNLTMVFYEFLIIFS